MSADFFDRSRIAALVLATLVDVRGPIDFEELVEKITELIDPHLGFSGNTGRASRAVRTSILHLCDENVLIATSVEDIVDEYLGGEKDIEWQAISGQLSNEVISFGPSYPVYIDKNADAFSSACNELGIETPSDLSYLVQRQSSIPASDRWVTLDHNSPEVQEVTEGLRNLEQMVQTSNEAGQIFGDQREAIASEVSALRIMWQSAIVRVGAMKSVANSTLGWIGRKAAEAVVGAAALAILGKILGLLG